VKDLNLKKRLENLEARVVQTGREGPKAVPWEWCERGLDGEMLGPPPGAKLSPGLQRAWEAMKLMDSTIPAAPPGDEG